MINPVIFTERPRRSVALLMVGTCIGSVATSALFIALGVLRVVMAP